MNNTLLTQDQQAKIELAVKKLLTRNPARLNQWETLKKIVEQENIKVEEGELKDISGMLLQRAGKQWTIIVNRDDSQARKLFSIAHELGHYFLHRKEQQEFIDSDFVQNYWERSENTKRQKIELEANQFAGSLIMPKTVIEEKLPGKMQKIEYDQASELAQKFGVSVLAMITRLKNLGYNA